MDNTQHASKIQLIHFWVNQVRMCAYLHNIQKVLPLVALENVPGGPTYLAGLMNIKGEIVPVIDLALRAGMNRKDIFSLNMPILLCANANKSVAMIVDEIIGLTDFDETKLQMNKEFNKPDSPFLAAITQDFDSSLLINIDYLLAVDLIKDQNTYASKNKQ